MSELDDLEAELLGDIDESASEAEEDHTQAILKSPSPSLRQKSDSPAVSKNNSRAMSASARGVARRKPRDEDEDDEPTNQRAPSPVGSVGSAAMSESDDEPSSPAPAPMSSSRKVDNASEFKLDGIFIDERDRSAIMALPEIEREQIIAEREEARQQEDFVAKLRQKTARDQEDGSDSRKRKATDVDDTPRKTARSKTSATVEKYKRQREQNIEQRRRGERFAERRDRRSPSRDDGYSDEDGDANSDADWDTRPSKPAAIKSEPPASLRDFQRVQLGRTNFAKVCFTPGFETKIVGCFTRASVGPDPVTRANTYRMVEIKRIGTGKPYGMVGTNGRAFHTDQYVVAMMNGKEQWFPFLATSDSPFTLEDYERYKGKAASEGKKTPVLSQLANKCEDITSLIEHRWTDAEITEKMKRSGKQQSLFDELRTGDLEKMRAQAVVDGNEGRIKEIEDELRKIAGPQLAFGTGSAKKAIAESKPLSQQERLAARNAANRKLNAENIRRAQLAEIRQEKELEARIKRGEAKADPFARTKTRAKILHDENEKARSQGMLKPPKDDLFGDSDVSRAGTPANGTPKLEATKPGSKKNKTDDEILAELDFGIDIEI